MKILFTGGGGAGNEALWRLMRERHELHFADADRDGIDSAIPADRRHVIPWASDGKFVDAMVDLCGRLRIDLLVPGVDEELAGLAAAEARFGTTKLLLPPLEYVSAMSDKLTMIRTLAGRGIPVPNTMPLGETTGAMSFPCIMKPRHGRGSRDVQVVPGAVQLESIREQLGGMASSMLVQEKLGGTEYTVQMIADRQARLHAIVPVLVTLKRGITLRARTDDHPAVIAACRAIHQAVPTSGCYNIQAMRTDGGAVLPFEINTRISTTFCLTVAAGIDPFEIYIGDKTPTALPAIPRLALNRFWTNHLSTIS